MSARTAKLVSIIPERISDSAVLNIIKTQDWRYVHMLKDYTKAKDELLSEWLNINVKTFRNYKKQDADLKDNLKEQAVLLISLFKHGVELFGSHKDFHEWLQAENFFLDGAQPIAFLTTATGVRFIDDRLTALEYGDNV